MTDFGPNPPPTPVLDESANEAQDEIHPLLLLGVLLVLLAVAAIVFLLVPTSWIGARVEVLYNQ
jgi:hypothetical protein